METKKPPGRFGAGGFQECKSLPVLSVRDGAADIRGSISEVLEKGGEINFENRNWRGVGSSGGHVQGQIRLGDPHGCGGPRRLTVDRGRRMALTQITFCNKVCS